MTFAFRKNFVRSHRFGVRLRRDENGVAAIEFALVAMPFIALLFGIMGVCHIFFWMFTLENAVWSASRDLRTGAFQTASLNSRYAGLTGDALKNELKKAICEKAVNYADCMAHSAVLVQSVTSFAGLQQPNCRTSSNGLISDATANAAFNAGSQSSVVLVTLCHSWSFGVKLSYLPMGNALSDGGLLIQASSAFRTEPYN